MFTKNRCKKIASLFIALSLLTLCLINLSGCQSLFSKLSNETNNDTNENIELVMDIQTHPNEEDNSLDNDDNNADICYYSLTTDGKVTEAEPFTPDEMEIFTVPVNRCFNEYTIEFGNSNHTHRNYTYISDMILEDEDGKNVEITPIISDIFKEALAIGHDMFEMKIFKLDDEYFVYAELNVNLWYPCGLYYYNQEASKLIKLYEFDDEEITGIKIHSLDSFNKQYYY